MEFLFFWSAVAAVFLNPILVFVLLAIGQTVAHQWRRDDRQTLEESLGRVTVFVFGVATPIQAFMLSCLPVESRADALFGWVTCIGASKWLLLPFVLWAAVAFHRSSDWSREVGRWQLIGLWTGVAISVISLIAGLGSRWQDRTPFAWFHPRGFILWPHLFAAFYTPIWYAFRAREVGRRVRLTRAETGVTLVAYAPVASAVVLDAMRRYAELPATTSSGCFVVTAASSSRLARRRRVDIGGVVVGRQLAGFKLFELMLRVRFPRLHGVLRRRYDRVGPRIAGWIRRRPLRADFVYLALKPMEWSLG